MDSGGRQGTGKSVTEQDLISKLENTNPAKNLNSQVDCTLKLGLPQPQQAAASSQMGHDYGNVMTERVNANQGSPGGMNVPYGGGGGPSVPVLVISNNNYGNLYYMNPQNNVAVNNNIQAAGRNEGLVRKCMACQTSSTPLWRKGPDGDKSLCNACGIHYRKLEKKI